MLQHSKTVSNELAKRFSMGDLNYEESTENLPVLIAQMASLLDPRYKNLKFEPSEQIKYRIQAMVRSKILSVDHISIFKTLPRRLIVSGMTDFYIS